RSDSLQESTGADRLLLRTLLAPGLRHSDLPPAPDRGACPGDQRVEEGQCRTARARQGARLDRYRVRPRLYDRWNDYDRGHYDCDFARWAVNCDLSPA